MKVRCNSALISALLLSLCLVTCIPEALRKALTWKQLLFEWPECHLGMPNFLMPLGCAHIGIVTIGLIVLWVAYRRRERWAWFVMLVILLCFELPWAALPETPAIRSGWSFYLTNLFRVPWPNDWWHCLVTAQPECCNIAIGLDCMVARQKLDLLRLPLMSVALLVPVKAFFWRRSTD
jgi:hypothetical protein